MADVSDPINANPNVLDISQLPTRSINLNSKVLPYLESEKKICETVCKLSFLSLPVTTNELQKGTVNNYSSSNNNDQDHEDDEEDKIDAQEVYDLISTISDPEHPLTLGQLSVVNLSDIFIRYPTDERLGEILVKITPTITHCSLATLIGLGIRVRLERSIPKDFRLRIYLKEGSHQSESQVNKQLNDKERVCAACENPQLLKVLAKMLGTCL